VQTVEQSVISSEGLEMVKRAECVFGCMDQEGARLFLTEVCSAYRIPYLDIVTGVVQGGKTLSSEPSTDFFFKKSRRDER